MAAKIISQKKFAKLVASTGSLSQPPGALTRLSNLLFTQRGSLQIADGSQAISAAISPASFISAIAAFANLQAGQFPYYELLAYSPTPQLADVTGFAVASISAGTDNPAGTYTFAIAANLGSLHTNPYNSSIAPALGAFDTVNFTWTAVAGATGYTIYYIHRHPRSPVSDYIVLGTSAGTTFSFTGTLPTSPAVIPYPTFNNTFELLLYVSIALVSTPPQVAFAEVTAGVFPFAPPQPATLAPGSVGFNATPSIPGFSPYGGIYGVAGPLPQLVQFAGESILILGNGYAPQQVDPSLGAVAPVTPLRNTFEAAYPAWQAGVDWTTGSQLAALNGGINYLFTATQGGVSGSSTPSWNFTTGSQTSDGSVVWTCNGPIVVSVAPIGAAHAVAYAGSLWLANTHPTTTSYPSWIPTNTYVASQQIVVVDGSGNQWLFQVQTGGVSGSSAPSWDFTIGNTTADGTVVWLCVLEFENAAGTQTHTSGVQTTNGSGNWSFVGTQWRSNFNPGSSALANLVFMGFGFSIPPTATILGIIVTSTLVSQATTAGTLSQVALYYMNAVLGTIKTPGTNFTTTPTPQSYGSTSDLWGASLTPAIVNDPSFGFAMAATCDSIRVFIGQPFQVTVYYTTTTSGSSALAAGIDGPTCLKMSDSNNPNSWNPVNTAFIGRDDGTQITGLQPFTIAALGISPTGSLCVFKEFTTYQIIGVFGSSSFEIQPAQTNLGCIAARSIQFLPGFGVVRFSHLGFAVFDGINDRLISEDIRPYLFGGVDSEADLTPVDPSYLYLAQSAQTTQPPMYLCAMPLLGSAGQLTRLFVYDLVMKAWTVLDLPWPITALSAVAVGEGYPLVLAGKTDGTVQRVQAGDLNWDSGADDQTAVNWGFRSPDVFGEGSSQRLFFQQAVIRGYGNPKMVASIVANLWLDGKQLGSQAIDIVPMGGANLFEVNVKLFVNGERAHLDISGNGGGAPGVIDSVDWAVSPKSSLARRIIG